MHSMQVILTGAPTACVVNLESTTDSDAENPVWGVIGQFSLANGRSELG